MKMEPILVPFDGVNDDMTQMTAPASPLPGDQGYNFVKNTILERYKFNKRCQSSAESIYDYVAHLMDLAELCDFGGLKDGLIRDRLLCEVNDVMTIAKLLSTPDLTLERAVHICVGIGEPDTLPLPTDGDPADNQAGNDEEYMTSTQTDADHSDQVCESDPGDAENSFDEESGEMEEEEAEENDNNVVSACDDSGTETSYKMRGYVYPCTTCDKVFQRPSKLRDHEATHTGVRQYSCSVCTKSFITAHVLKNHMLTHSNDRDHYCDICNKGFKRASEVKAHRLIHSSDRPYTCEQCGKQMKTPSDLKKHMSFHTGKRRVPSHICQTCGKAFVQSSDLRVHTRVHTKERPFLCDLCGSGFKTTGDLKKHSRVHNPEKAFKCGICGKEFKRADILKVHQGKHADEKGFTCYVCGKRFSYLSVLNRHIKTHSQLKLDTNTEKVQHQDDFEISEKVDGFGCSICGEQFSHLSVLNRHITTHSELKLTEKLKPVEDFEIHEYVEGMDDLDGDSDTEIITPMSGAVEVDPRSIIYIIPAVTVNDQFGEEQPKITAISDANLAAQISVWGSDSILQTLQAANIQIINTLGAGVD